MLSNRFLIPLMAIATTFIDPANASATDGPYYRWDRNPAKYQYRSFYGGDGLPTHIRGIGTYSGGISGIRAPRNGIYFSVEGTGYSPYPAYDLPARPRIIHVNKTTIGAECSYEASVCIIRGTQ